ncbi:MAG: lipid-A-disaccharide synthase, partial [Candidatus Competibacterales bacterium]|nr:lipid-A-disaccharide synthase [Candidatus Competibacterales bacterium]
MEIALLAGEPSGDGLGAGLIEALRRHYPQARFVGVGGERMQAAGLESLVPLDALSVMGLTEVLRHLPRLVRLRRRLLRTFLARRPAVFVGIDAPDFNLGLERRLRAAGIPAAHYVSPSVWAWRRGRVRGIARSVDLMLALLPFEADFYRDHGVAVRYVGHPLADSIPLHSEPGPARTALDLDRAGPWLALLPGSRLGEIEQLAPPFLATARWLRQRRPDLGFVVPLATPRVGARFRQLQAAHAPELPLTLVEGQARTVLAAADVVLVASGTATLEALLVKRPMVVAYRLTPVTAWLARRLVRAPYFSLPNLLAGCELVPECFQDRVRPEVLGPALLELLTDIERRRRL